MKKYKIFAIFLLIASVALFFSGQLSLSVAGLDSDICELVLECDGDCEKTCYNYEQCLPLVQGDTEYACVVSDGEGFSGQINQGMSAGGNNGQGQIA